MTKERFISFIVTKDCQLRCKYCYLVGKSSGHVMTHDVAFKAIDYFLQSTDYFKEPSVVFEFIGGEPLLEIELISDIMEYTIEEMKRLNHIWCKHFKIGITTNGLLYSSRKVQTFIEKYKEQLEIRISIDGTKTKNDLNRIFPNGQGSYDKLIPAISLWRQQFDSLSTRMTISHDDLPYIYDSVVHLISLGISRIDMNPVVEAVWQPNDDKVFEEQLIKLADYIVDNELHKCMNFSIFEEGIGHPLQPNDDTNPCNYSQVSVDADGNFFLCLRFADFSLRAKKARTIGNVYQGIDLNKMRPYLMLNNLSLNSDKDCIKCEIASGCKWCPAENYDSSDIGSIFHKSTAICQIHRARVKAKNYYWYRVNKASLNYVY